MKIKFNFVFVGVVPIVLCAIGFYKCVQQKSTVSTSQNYKEFNNDTINQASASSISKQASSSQKIISKPDSAGGRTAVDYKEYIARAGYSPQVRYLAETITSLLSDFKINPNADTAYKLFRALHMCRDMNISEEEMESIAQDSTDQVLGGGGDNAAVLDIDNGVRERFQQCQSVSGGIDGTFAEAEQRYLELAAKMGSADAGTQLALGFQKPQNFDSWSDKNKQDYRNKVGEYLLSAREQCDPQAFHIYGTTVSLGDTWYDVSGDPPRISQYANYWAMGKIYSNRYANYPKRMLYGHARKLERLVTEYGLSEEEIMQAKKYGDLLYEQHCK